MAICCHKEAAISTLSCKHFQRCLQSLEFHVVDKTVESARDHASATILDVVNSQSIRSGDFARQAVEHFYPHTLRAPPLQLSYDIKRTFNHHNDTRHKITHLNHHAQWHSRTPHVKKLSSYEVCEQMGEALRSS